MQYMVGYDRTGSDQYQNGKQAVDHEAVQTFTFRCLQGLHES